MDELAITPLLCLGQAADTLAAIVEILVVMCRRFAYLLERPLVERSDPLVETDLQSGFGCREV